MKLSLLFAYFLSSAYMVGSETYGFSTIFSFRTWPAGSDWSPRLAIFGDMGNENAQSLPRLQMDAAHDMYDAILHVGMLFVL